MDIKKRIKELTEDYKEKPSYGKEMYLKEMFNVGVQHSTHYGEDVGYAEGFFIFKESNEPALSDY